MAWMPSAMAGPTRWSSSRTSSVSTAARWVGSPCASCSASSRTPISASRPRSWPDRRVGSRVPPVTASGPVSRSTSGAPSSRAAASASSWARARRISWTAPSSPLSRACSETSTSTTVPSGPVCTSKRAAGQSSAGESGGRCATSCAGATRTLSRNPVPSRVDHRGVPSSPGWTSIPAAAASRSGSCSSSAISAATSTGRAVAAVPCDPEPGTRASMPVGPMPGDGAW